MSTSQNKGDEPLPPPEKSTVILLLTDIADTTWRMFMPTLGGAALGWWADSQWKTSPWLALGGLGLGVLASAFLVKQQLDKVKNAK